MISFIIIIFYSLMFLFTIQELRKLKWHEKKKRRTMTKICEWIHEWRSNFSRLNELQLRNLEHYYVVWTLYTTSIDCSAFNVLPLFSCCKTFFYLTGLDSGIASILKFTKKIFIEVLDPDIFFVVFTVKIDRWNCYMISSQISR